VRLLRTILGLGIVPHLFQFHQPGPSELNIERKPLFRFPTGIPDLVDLRLRQGFAVALGLLACAVVVAATGPAGDGAELLRRMRATYAGLASYSDSGTVTTANVAKRTFTLTSGTVTYTVHFSSKTKFTAGSAAKIVAGAKVTVMGRTLKNIVHAASISA